MKQSPARLASKRRYRERHHAKIANYQFKWRRAHRKHIADYTLLWQKQNPEQYKPIWRRNQLRQRAILSDAYICKLLRDRSEQVNPTTIKLCKQRIQIQRASKILKFQATASAISQLSVV